MSGLKGSTRPRDDAYVAANLLYQELCPHAWFSGVTIEFGNDGQVPKSLVVEVRRVELARDVPKEYFGWPVSVKRNCAIVS